MKISETHTHCFISKDYCVEKFFLCQEMTNAQQMSLEISRSCFLDGVAVGKITTWCWVAIILDLLMAV